MANFITCANNSTYTFEQLLNALLTKTASGEWALRTMQVDACTQDAITCDTRPMDSFEVLKNIVGINECGKPAIRLAIDQSGM